ncbi:hypothetical protein C882_4423 [Caenispirillum salinarum AK4]|uniref:DUF2333 domain-containing protein n=1 Tax=Caenispirillum salinarum AK4 TaxID=1238182 RepID=K9H087_9PROT|nr:DUF2333 family protein [Caenispirillum salinarum]EKV30464.1 hypothetical protein C882_4423 [Caenispirillum salinarum AK4]
MLRSAIDRLPLDRLPLDRMPRGRVMTGILIVVLLVALYYPIGMVLTNEINDDVAYTPAEAFQVDGGSQAVSMAAALIHREIDETTWVANKPWLFPGSALDNMPNYQIGLMYAISRFAIEMTDSLGRTRGSSQADADLDRASGLLKYDGTIWVWEPSTSLLPTASATKQYAAGQRALMSYNQRLAAGEAVYDKRADNLIAFLDRVAADLGSSSAALDARATESDAGYFDALADDIFYSVKGRLYGYTMLLDAVGRDFSDVIAEKNVGQAWDQMLASMRSAAVMDPLVVANGANDGLIVPSHLTAQGFYLLRARTQLREVASILAK